MSRDQSLLTHCLMVCAPGLGWAYPNFDNRYPPRVRLCWRGVKTVMSMVGRASYIGYPWFDDGLGWGHPCGEDGLMWGRCRGERGYTSERELGTHGLMVGDPGLRRLYPMSDERYPLW